MSRQSGEVQTDHPHARGENEIEAGSGPAPDGPSPRTWGEHPRLFFAFDPSRTIPTHVGRTARSAINPDSSTDHPHARGENVAQEFISLQQTGPSPRTWGERNVSRPVVRCVRTIPTHVGRTRARTGAGPSMADHPHARGENARERRSKKTPAGPSPRTWGEHEGCFPLRISGRTIPTHVGRTRPIHELGATTPDHPHARGENEAPFSWRTARSHHPHARGENELSSNCGCFGTDREMSAVLIIWRASPSLSFFLS